MLKSPANRRTFLNGILFAAAMAVPKHAAAANELAAKELASTHIVLLGDSVFDNGAYVAGGPSVAQQLRDRLPSGARVTLAAIDGTVTSGVTRQLEMVPVDATHLVVSAGGNDALGHTPILDEKASSVNEALELLSNVRERFAQDYQAMLDSVLRLGIATAVCTVYDAQLPQAKQRRSASVGLTIFNDCITRAAFAHGIGLIDLRLICDAVEDFGNGIEPSEVCGAKIANAIVKFASARGSSNGRSDVFV